MRLPRFTVRQLMVLVAVVGVVLGIMIQRYSRFSKIAAHHRAEMDKLHQKPVSFAGSSEWFEHLLCHRSLLIKYQRAARYPWLPIAPDPMDAE